MKIDFLSAKEVKRRLNVICNTAWERQNLTFECTPKTEEWEATPIPNRRPTRGLLVGIEMRRKKIVIETTSCYKYRYIGPIVVSCPDLAIEIPSQELVPYVLAGMLWLEHAAARIIVFRVDSELFKT